MASYVTFGLGLQQTWVQVPECCSRHKLYLAIMGLPQIQERGGESELPS